MTEGHPEHQHHQDPTFYRSPRDAAAAPPEKLAYVAAFSRPADQPDAMAVVDVDPQSAGYGSVVGFTQLTNLGGQLDPFGWKPRSSRPCPGWARLPPGVGGRVGAAPPARGGGGRRPGAAPAARERPRAALVDKNAPP